jgi:RAD50-interacting protein 1
LKDFTRSEKSDEAVRRFELLMIKLQRLDVASGYMELLKEVDKLRFVIIVEASGTVNIDESFSSQAHQKLKASPRLAIEPYRRLRSLVTAVKAAQPAAEGAAPHLVDHIEQQAHTLYNSLKNGFESDLNKTLDEMNWPNKELKLTHGLVARWTDQVEALLDLQEPDLHRQAAEALGSSSAQDPTVLLPLEVMVKPLGLRFRYHFFSDKPTNRLDKPEYFLSHVLDLLDTHNDFMLDYMQPILDQRSRTTDLDDTMYTDAMSEFITALLPMVSAKCLSLLPQISTSPSLLSHFIRESMSFDTTLRDSWAYTPVPQVLVDWKGLTWSMLTTYGYFATWLQVEKNFALERYRNIRDSTESNELDFDSTGPGTTVPTKGAIRVNDLLETVTDRYRLLSSFSQKLKFFIDIQLAIFDDYYQHLRESHQSYRVNSTIAGKLVQNAGMTEDPATDVSGLKGLQKLSKIFGSAEYLERKMSDWSDDIFFLELWDELQDRARRNTGANGSVGRDLPTKEVASRTSATIANESGKDAEVETGDGALFDETESAYRGLRILVENDMADALKSNVRTTLKPYSKVSGWASISTNVSDASQLSPSASLDATLQVLSAQLGFLSTVLAAAPLRRITRQVCFAIQKDILESVIMRHSFSSAGVAQLRRDLVAVEAVIDSSINAPDEAQRCMKRLEDSLVLLSLPIKASQKETDQVPEDDGWDFEDDEEDAVMDGDVTRPDVSNENKTWSLWEVEKLIFKNNDSARDILAALRLDSLNEADARTILKRRVELGS